MEPVENTELADLGKKIMWFILLFTGTFGLCTALVLL